jgi:hypothetical protein
MRSNVHRASFKQACPRRTATKDSVTVIDFFGPESPNPGMRAIPADYKDFGPAVGFAYQAPWFGANRDDHSRWISDQLHRFARSQHIDVAGRHTGRNRK